MPRLIHYREDLRGQTFGTALAARDVTEYRQSYLGECDLRGATFVGDFRGSDVLGCQAAGLDLSRALIYGCVWRGSTFDETTVFPPDVGVNQDEITYEHIRRFIPQMPERWRQRARDILEKHRLGDYESFCALARDVWSKDQATATAIWEAMPARTVDFLKRMFMVGACTEPQTAQDVTWPDGVSVHLERDRLPKLEHPDYRYELDQWILKQAGPAGYGMRGRYCWTARIRPWLGVFVFPLPDDWFSPGYGGF